MVEFNSYRNNDIELCKLACVECKTKPLRLVQILLRTVKGDVLGGLYCKPCAVKAKDEMDIAIGDL